MRWRGWGSLLSLHGWGALLLIAWALVGLYWQGGRAAAEREAAQSSLPAPACGEPARRQGGCGGAWARAMAPGLPRAHP